MQMKIFKNKTKLNKELINAKNLSFVPTMGGLHAGHKFLIKKAQEKSKKVIVTIFVNPKQFNSKKDYKNYPKNLSKDLKILKRLKVDIVYLPTYKDIYSFKTVNKIFLHKFNKQLCGKYRKNHFLGVLNVVNRMLEIIKPKFLFLGKKDYQQLRLIIEHIRKRKLNIKVIQCKTIREKNGVVCSSRNMNLNRKDVFIASQVYLYLKKQKRIMKKRKYIRFNEKQNILKIKKLGIKKVEYVKCINLSNLIEPKLSISKFNIFISYYINKTRLIDNI